MVRFFEVEDGVVKPTEHCHTLEWLRAVMTEFPEREVHVKAYAYIFYMSCPSQENPYYNVKFTIRDETIQNDMQFPFSLEHPVILAAIYRAKELFETPTVRAHRAISMMLDNVVAYMETASITTGRDGNLPALIKLAEKFDDIRQSYKNATKDLELEQQTVARGKQDLAYDQ